MTILCDKITFERGIFTKYVNTCKVCSWILETFVYTYLRALLHEAQKLTRVLFMQKQLIRNYHNGRYLRIICVPSEIWQVKIDEFVLN